jgi:hypothetical protein
VRLFARTLFAGIAVGLLGGCALVVSFSGFGDGGVPEADVSSQDASLDGSELPDAVVPSDAGRADADDVSTPVEGAVGCYLDSAQQRDLPYLVYNSNKNTVESCVAACTYHGYLYAGAQNGIQCYCGNGYGGRGPSGNCTIPCPGNAAEICGGPYSNSVYRTSVTPD